MNVFESLTENSRGAFPTAGFHRQEVTHTAKPESAETTARSEVDAYTALRPGVVKGVGTISTDATVGEFPASWESTQAPALTPEAAIDIIHGQAIEDDRAGYAD